MSHSRQCRPHRNLSSLVLFLLIAGSLLLCPHYASAAAPLALRASDTYQLGGPFLDILEDKSASLTIADVTSPALARSFTPSKKSVPNFGMSQSAFWFRFTIDGGSRSGNQWVLFLDQPVMDEVDLFIPKADGSFDAKQSGDARLIKIRDTWSRNIALPLPVQNGATTYYLRAWISGRAQFPLTVMTNQAFQRKNSLDDSVFAACGGFMLAMVIVGLTLLVFSRDRSYLFFALYILSSLGAVATVTGYYYAWFFPNDQSFYHTTLPLFTILMIVTGLLFTRSFLRLHETVPLLDKALMWLAVLSVLLIPCSVLMPQLYFKTGLNMAYMAATVFSLAAAVGAHWKGFAPARYFLFSRIVVYIGAFIYALKNFGLISADMLSANVGMIIPVLDAAFITLALADRIKMQTRQINGLVADLRQEIDEGAAAHRVLEEEMSERIRLEREIVRVSDEERIKISYELHDGLCQQLTGARLLCSALGKNLISKENSGELLSPLERLLDEAVDQAYDLSRGVWPIELDTQGKMPSLEELTWRMSRQSGISIQFHEARSCTTCGNGHIVQLYRIVQESLANAIKHSKARSIAVSIECDQQNGVRVEIRDDGIGRDSLPKKTQGGMGIRIMEHRARTIGGTFTITDTQGGGTTVICTAPCTTANSTKEATHV